MHNLERQFLVFSLILQALFFVPPLHAEEEVALDPAAKEEAAHDALRELRGIYEKAINERKPELLEPYLDEGFTGVMVTGEVVTSYAGLEAYWRKLEGLIGKGGTYTTKLEPDLSWIHGDIALAKGSSQDVVATGGGKEYRFETSWTAVLVEREGGWKLRRIQGTMDPVNNVFVAAAARQGGLLGGGAGLVVGLLAGLLIMRLRR